MRTLALVAVVAAVCLQPACSRWHQLRESADQSLSEHSVLHANHEFSDIDQELDVAHLQAFSATVRRLTEADSEEEQPVEEEEEPEEEVVTEEVVEEQETPPPETGGGNTTAPAPPPPPPPPPTDEPEPDAPNEEAQEVEEGGAADDGNLRDADTGMIQCCWLLLISTCCTLCIFKFSTTQARHSCGCVQRSA